jgi:hypothetical protein
VRRRRFGRPAADSPGDPGVGARGRRKHPAEGGDGDEDEDRTASGTH